MFSVCDMASSVVNSDRHNNIDSGAISTYSFCEADRPGGVGQSERGKHNSSQVTSDCASNTQNVMPCLPDSGSEIGKSPRNSERNSSGVDHNPNSGREIIKRGMDEEGLNPSIETSSETTEDVCDSGSSCPLEDRLTDVSSEKEEEDERQDSVKLSDSLTFSSSRDVHRQRGKPGVILLGRGNSFSLGRSEVILLHTSRHTRTKTRNPISNNNNDENFKVDSGHQCDTSQNYTSEPIPAPPPFSNGELPDVVPNGDSQTTPNFDVDELEMLWRRVESIMTAKQANVQQVLEEFGIGEAGGGGNEVDERAEEEESVWQAVQDNFQV